MEKVISDYIVTTKETIFLLQQWLTWLEQQGEVVEFEVMCQQLREAGLGGWLERTGGYELKTLRQAIADPTSAEVTELAE